MARRGSFYPAQRISWRLYNASCTFCLEAFQSSFSNVAAFRYSPPVNSFRISIQHRIRYKLQVVSSRRYGFCLFRTTARLSPRPLINISDNCRQSRGLICISILRKVQNFSCAYRSRSRSSIIVYQAIYQAASVLCAVQAATYRYQIQVRAFSYLPKRLSAADRRSPHRSE